jgi:hypothetical protein
MIVLPRISIKRRIQTQVSAVARCFAALPRIQFVELAFKEWLLLGRNADIGFDTKHQLSVKRSHRPAIAEGVEQI